MGEKVEKRFADITFRGDFPRVANSNNYSQSPLYRRHPLIKETSLLWTVCFVPWEKSLCIFSKFNPLKKDTFYDPHSVQFNGVDYATLAFQRSFTLETPSKIGEAVKTTGKPRTRKIFEAFGV